MAAWLTDWLTVGWDGFSRISISPEKQSNFAEAWIIFLKAEDDEMAERASKKAGERDILSKLASWDEKEKKGSVNWILFLASRFHFDAYHQAKPKSRQYIKFRSENEETVLFFEASTSSFAKIKRKDDTDLLLTNECRAAPFINRGSPFERSGASLMIC